MTPRSNELTARSVMIVSPYVCLCILYRVYKDVILVKKPVNCRTAGGTTPNIHTHSREAVVVITAT